MDDLPATLESKHIERQDSRQVSSNSANHQRSRNPNFEQTGPVVTTGGRVMKFAYASGSKPLDGYTIKRGIGIGGFGEVYFALSDAGKEVALKRIQRNLDVELRGVRQCLNLKHINLISLWDIRTNNLGESWVVMEYVPGKSLHDILDANPSGLPEEDVKQWFSSIAAGVAYLHDQGIVHRDLKPGNIFYDEDQQVIKIGDYGLSKFISCSRRSGQTESVGTFHYMAPEIGKGEYGKEIDIYALGIILFEVLTGNVPFNGESSQEIIMKHLTADPELTVVPEKFRGVIRKALLKDPETRYSNVPEMCSDLPWPDIAENSQEIVKRNAVGQVVLNGYSDKPDLSQSANPNVEQSLAASDKLKFPNLLAGERPEIVFGELRDSTAGVNPKSHGVPSTHGRPDSNGVARNGSSANSPNGKISIGNVSVNRGTTPSQNRIQSEPNHRNGNGRTPVAAVDPVQVIPTSRVATPSMPTVRGGVVEEPIARVLKNGFGETANWWNNAGISTPVKIAILVTGTYAVSVNSDWLLPTVFAMGLVYLVYYIARSMWMTNQEEENEKQPKINLKEIRREQEESVRAWIGRREMSDKFMELTASLLIGALACLGFNLLALVIGGGFVSSGVKVAAIFAWLSLISIGATWALLIVGKCWEHQGNDSILRRIVMGAIGVGVGVIAFTTAGSLNVDLTKMAVTGYSPVAALQVGPVLGAFLFLFGGLFLILRWGRQTDPMRRTRLSIWVVGLCLVWAAVLSQFLGINPLWNSIIAVVISVSAQVASPWLNPLERKRIQVETINASAVKS